MQQQNKRRLIIGAQGLTLGAIAVGAVGFVAADKTVELSVDGQNRSVQTFGNDVASVLRAANVSVGGNDEVSPSLDSPVREGTVVRVLLARDVALNVDGQSRVVNTTAQTVGELASELGIESGSKLSLSDSIDLASTSAPLTVRTPKQVRLSIAGKERTVTTTALDVKAALAEINVRPDADDTVSPALNTVVTDGLSVEYTRVQRTTKKVKSEIAFSTTTIKDSTLEKGTTKTQTQGVEGEREATYAVVLENGKQVSKRLKSEKTTKEAVNKVVRVGTKEEVEEAPAETETKQDSGSSAKSGTTSSGPSSGVWYQLAKCESGGNWGINTGNGYYGGLQFSASTWIAQGGGKYAALPHQATAAQQIEIATKLQARAGWGQWPACTRKLGLR